MTANPVATYLDALDEPHRSTLRQLRSTIVELLPDAEECLAYGAPAYKVDGKAIAGFAAFTRHLSYLPHSGSVLGSPELEVALADYATSKGALRFAVDEPLPRALVELLVNVRLREVRGTKPGGSSE